MTVPLHPVGVRDGIDPVGLSVGAALPDGRVVLAGLDPGHGLVLAQLRADGSLDPAFGEGGVAHLSVPVGPPYIGPDPLQLLRGGDGRLLIAMEGATLNRFELRQLLVARLTADGQPDTTFGEGGISQPGVEAGCGGGCAPMALYPDGSIALAGATGSAPAMQSQFRWVVARLAPSGALDPSFGSGGVATVAGGVGYAAAVPPRRWRREHRAAQRRAKLARLTAAGGLDPAFHGGASVDLSAAPSGSICWLTPAGASSASGAAAVHGAAALRTVRRARRRVRRPRYGAAARERDRHRRPGGGTWRWGDRDGSDDAEPGDRAPGRAGLTHRVGRSRPGTGVVRIPFGGGYATGFAARRAPVVGPLQQGSFRAGTPVARSDGTLVVPGSVSVIEGDRRGCRRPERRGHRERRSRPASRSTGPSAGRAVLLGCGCGYRASAHAPRPVGAG